MNAPIKKRYFASRDYYPANPTAFEHMNAAVDALLDNGRRLVGKKSLIAARRACIEHTILGLLAHHDTQSDESRARAMQTIEALKHQLAELPK